MTTTITTPATTTTTEEPNREPWIAYMADDAFFCPTCCPAGDYTEQGALILPLRPSDYISPKKYYKFCCDTCGTAFLADSLK